MTGYTGLYLFMFIEYLPNDPIQSGLSDQHTNALAEENIHAFKYKGPSNTHVF